MNHLRKFINWVTNVTYLNKSSKIIEILEQCQNTSDKLEVFEKVEKWLIKDLHQIRKDNTDLINNKKAENEKITKYLGMNTPVSVSMMNVDFEDPIKNG